MNAFAEFVHELLLDPNEQNALSDEFFDDDKSEDEERYPEIDPQTGFLLEVSEMSPLCEHCEERLRLPNEDYCETCRDNLAEAAYERSQGECFRGGEAAAFTAESQARIQRELK